MEAWLIFVIGQAFSFLTGLFYGMMRCISSLFYHT